MIQKIALSTVKVRPTDKKIKKSICAAQRVSLNMKNRAPIDSRQMAAKAYDGISFIKNALYHKAV